MKFLLCFLFLLTISPIDCIVLCSTNKDCPSGLNCVNNGCYGTFAHRRFSDDPQHCDPECPAHLACLWGQCVDGRRRFQGLSECSSQCGPFQRCVFGQATITNQDDPSNVHQYNGFLTIQQYKESEESPDKGALTTVSNTGIIMIEEGEILDEKSSTEGAPTLMLTPTYQLFKFPVNSGGNSNLKNPERSKRWFTLKNKRLMQYMVREFKGRTHKFTKIYKKTQEFKYL